MKPDDLAAQARRLLRASLKRPRDVDLRRAVSAAYYALFHTIAGEAGNLLVGTAGASRSDKAWRQVYRSLQHGDAKSRCELQKRRHDADYDPDARFLVGSAENYVKRSEDAIAAFRGSTAKDRRAFVVWLLFPNRR